MPNQKGGKNYKKSKHTSGMKPIFIERQPDQMYARIVKNLGNRNLLVYCNDNKVRLAHIRGSMRKRIWLAIGDIVLISLRDFEKSTAESGKTYEKGDIVAKYDEELLGRLRKEPDVNKKLFQQLETMDGVVLAEIGRKEQELTNLGLAEDLGADIEFGEGDAEGEASGESESDVDIDDI
jgi:translation initiation factor 1A